MAISLLAPLFPKEQTQSLTTILRIKTQNSISPYSKAPGVFPSSRRESVSSPTLHFHRIIRGDSSQIVIPFMRVTTYVTRDYATLTRSELPRTFTCGLDRLATPCLAAKSNRRF